MEIGKKIKKIRLAKNMTQSELAGDKITRNMLSQIENGFATPSVATIVYVAEKLEMPVGYFLAEAEDDFLYQKMIYIGAIKDAYSEKNYKKCVEICENNLSDTDDEIAMILCESHFRLGVLGFLSGQIASAHREFNTALQYADKTAYNIDWIRLSSCVYLEFIGTVSPSFGSKPIKNYCPTLCDVAHTDLFAYMRAVFAIEAKDFTKAEQIVLLPDFSDTAYAKHVNAKFEMEKQNYAKALEIIQTIIESADSSYLGETILYKIYSDMEICCRELKDFENAYICATKKANMISEIEK